MLTFASTVEDNGIKVLNQLKYWPDDGVGLKVITYRTGTWLAAKMLDSVHIQAQTGSDTGQAMKEQREKYSVQCFLLQHGTSGLPDEECVGQSIAVSWHSVR